MEEAYKGILHKRHQELLAGITWSSDFARSLYTEGVLSKDAIHELERENDSETRVFRLLAKLPHQSQSDAFGGLCRTLRKTGHDELAKRLDSDRQNIAWDFQSCPAVHSVPEYIKTVDEQLLKRLSTEEDAYIREVISMELRMRLGLLSTYMKQHVKTNRTLRSNIWSSCQDQHVLDVSLKEEVKKLGEEEDIIVDGNSGFATLLDWEADVNSCTVEHVAHLLKTLQTQNRDLKQEVQDTKDLLKEQRAGEQLRQELVVMGTIQSNSPQIQRKIHTLEQTIQQQDKQLIMLQGQSKFQEDFIHIPKLEFEKLLKNMAPYVRKGSNPDKPLPSLRDPPPKPSGTVKQLGSLNESIDVVLRQLDRMRVRLKETSECIVELEKERALVSKSLNVAQSSENTATVGNQCHGQLWADQVIQKFSMSEEERQHLETEVRSLRRRIGDMAQEQQDLMTRLGQLQLDSDKLPNKASASSPKTVPRSSTYKQKTPSSYTSAKQANEVRTKRGTAATKYSAQGRATPPPELKTASPAVKTRKTSAPLAHPHHRI